MRAAAFALCLISPSLSTAAAPVGTLAPLDVDAPPGAFAERCAGLFMFYAASAALSQGPTAEAALRVNRGRAETSLRRAVALRRESGEDAATASADAAASAARAASGYARRFGQVMPPDYLSAVKLPLAQSDRRTCLSRQDAARTWTDD